MNRFPDRFANPVAPLMGWPMPRQQFRPPQGGRGAPGGGMGPRMPQMMAEQQGGGAGGMGGLLNMLPGSPSPIPGMAAQGGMGSDPMMGGLLGGGGMFGTAMNGPEGFAGPLPDALQSLNPYFATPGAAGSIQSFMGGGGPGGSPFPSMDIAGGGGDFDLMRFLNGLSF